MYIDYDYDYSLYNYEENEWKTQQREILDRGGSLRQKSHRLSANVRAFLLGPKIRKEGDERRRDDRKLGQARSPARAREREKEAGGFASEKEKVRR